jgi:hypothetical protein
MTRILSELLQAEQPHFGLQLRQLEKVSGHNNIDIKLSVEVVQAARHKIHALGLDKHDTTAEELYHVLLARLSDDDIRLERALRTQAATYVSAEADLMSGLLHVLQQEAHGVTTFALKTATAKRLLKKNSPKRLLKGLGYRSVDSMLRAESPAALVAVAMIIEAAAWRRSWIDSYKQLRTSDFEDRQLAVVYPSNVRWQALTQKIITEQAHTILSVHEMGALVLLPLPVERRPGMIVASLGLALFELNKLSASATYLRASQVRADFTDRLRQVAQGSVKLNAPFLEQAISWQVVQQYFAKTRAIVNEDVFGPYTQAADFYWHNVEATLAKICPSLAFWENTNYLSFLEHGKTVSFNIVDVAINCCNAFSYEFRTAQHAQEALWHELTLRYVNHDSLEQAVASVMQPKLALETANNG